MTKAVALVLLSVLLLGSASLGLAGEVSLKASGEGEGKWVVLDSGGQEIGTLSRVGEGAYSLEPAGGRHLGIIKSNGDLELAGRHPAISPLEAGLYLDVSEAIQALK